MFYLITHTYPEPQRKYNSYEAEYLLKNYKNVRILSFSGYKNKNYKWVKYLKHKINFNMVEYLKMISFKSIKEFLKTFTSLNLALYAIDKYNITSNDKIMGYWLTRPSMIAYYISLITGAELYLQGHGSDVFLNLPSFFDEMYNKATYCFTVGSKNVEFLEKYIQTSDKLKKMYLGVKDYKYKKNNYRIKSNLKLISAGHFYKIKGFDLLINAIKNYIENIDNKIILYLAGEGPEKNKLLKLVSKYKIKNNIKFTGWLNEKELIKLMSTMDVYVLSSRSEGLPISLMQACSVGLPLICNNVGSVKDIAKENNSILNNDVKDSISLYKKIKEFANFDKVEKRQMGLASLKIYKEKFILEKNLEKKYSYIGIK